MSNASPARGAVRKDIEGMRAVAVAAVIINHLKSSALSGGFAGVDVFFVISGYLIGKHLLEDIQAGRFSYLRFYARRARRLLPALVTMLVVVWFVGWVLLTAQEFSALGKHIAAAAIFANNFLLWSESGYFDAPAATKPLLHLWSLGIEEQFYLLVPFLLWIGSNDRHASVRWVVRFSFVSLLVTELLPVPSFYLLDTRFWELGIGVAIGYWELHKSASQGKMPKLGNATYRECLAYSLALMFTAVLLYSLKTNAWDKSNVLASSGLLILFSLAALAFQVSAWCRDPNRWARISEASRRNARLLRGAAAITGVVLLLVSFVALTPADWPGPQTLLPVLGTALLILGGPDAPMNRLLGIRVLVWIGGISYPLYLWHWPMIVFWRMFAPQGGWPGGLILIGVALLVSWSTKALIEAPARFGRLGTLTVRIPPIWALASALLITGTIGVSALATAGYPGRFPPEIRDLGNWTINDPDPDVAWRVHRCYYYPGPDDAYAPYAPECTPSKRTGFPRLLLWGDSHAAHLYPGLANLQTRVPFDVVQRTSAGCPSTLSPLIEEGRGCKSRRMHMLAEMDQLAPDVVLFASAWELYMAAGNSEGVILDATRSDIRWLQKSGIRRIVLFGPGPLWDIPLPLELFVHMRLRRPDRIPERFGNVSNALWHLDAAMAEVAASTGADYVSVLKQFCNPQGCRTLGNPNDRQPDLLFRDRDHLTISGSRFLIDSAVPQIFGFAPIAD